MNTHDLFEQARAGAVDHLDLLSLEGGIYLLEIHAGDGTSILRDEAGQILKLRSIEQAKKVLKGITTIPLFLVHASVYNEMCGLQDQPVAPLRVTISLDSAN